jgi:hypothetical protein
MLTVLREPSSAAALAAWMKRSTLGSSLAARV